MREAVHTPDISALLNIAILRLDVESAAELCLTLQLRHDQWDGLAKGLNTLMPKGEKFKGGILPRTERLIAFLTEQGGRLKAEDVEVVNSLLVEEDAASVVDVAAKSGPGRYARGCFWCRHRQQRCKYGAFPRWCPLW
jgi:hypothetical protein